ncbi:GNAT family N-acetyltransferase [Actinokineospora sp.]|uniref:GNAT family N-acetyltransferase n=1 Tax=Actinokineospora sp. TaxID=1872133 RepID=UPI0040379EA3
MTGFRVLTAPEAAEALGAARARGFLGLDPVTQNDDLLARELTERQARVFGAGTAVLGCVLNPDNPRQAVVACTTDDPAPLAAFVEFLHRHLRCTSFIAHTTDARAAVLTECGFTRIGTLADHVYRGGRYHDEYVFHRAVEGRCAG